MKLNLLLNLLLSCLISMKKKVQFCRRNHESLFLLTLFVGIIIGCTHYVRTRVFPFFDGFRIPLGGRLGNDFQVMVDSSKSLLSSYSEFLAHPSGHPPFESVLMLGFSGVGEHLGYVLFTYLLIACLFCVIRLSFFLTADQKPGESWLGMPVLMTCILYHTYPVLFALERGNTDLIAAALMGISLWALFREKPVWSCLALAAASNIKVYPCLLIPILLGKLNRRQIAFFFGINALMMVCLGLPAIYSFIRVGISMDTQPFMWEGNHSLASWAEVAKIPAFHGIGPVILAKSLLLIVWVPLAAGGIFVSQILSNGMRRAGSLALSELDVSIVGLSICLMSLFPGHDYKLPIHLIPFFLMLGRSKINNSERATHALLLLRNIAITVSTACLFFHYTFGPAKALVLLFLAIIWGSSGFYFLGKSLLDHAVSKKIHALANIS